MPKQSSFSVAIPYHRNLGYLKRAIDSVIAQTLPPAELIIVDNSQNGEASCAVRNTHFPIRVINTEMGGGLSTYFNQCLDAAQTAWCSVMHSDDLLLPRYIEVISAAARTNPACAGVFCTTFTINDTGNRVFCVKDWIKRFIQPRQSGAKVIVKGEDGLARLLLGNFIMCPTMCYHIPVLGGNRFDCRWEYVVDLDLNGRLLLADKMFVGVMCQLYEYRRHAEATTAASEKSFKMFVETTQCSERLAKRAAEKGWMRASAIGRLNTICHARALARTVRNLFGKQWRIATQLICSYFAAQCHTSLRGGSSHV